MIWISPAVGKSVPFPLKLRCYGSGRGPVGILARTRRARTPLLRSTHTACMTPWLTALARTSHTYLRERRPLRLYSVRPVLDSIGGSCPACRACTRAQRVSYGWATASAASSEQSGSHVRYSTCLKTPPVVEDSAATSTKPLRRGLSSGR